MSVSVSASWNASFIERAIVVSIAVKLLRYLCESMMLLLMQGKSGCRWVSERCQWRAVSLSRLGDVDDDSQLPLWRVSIDLDVPPHQVLQRLRSPRTHSSSTLSRWRTLARLGDDVDLVEYVVTIPALDRARYFRVIR